MCSNASLKTQKKAQKLFWGVFFVNLTKKLCLGTFGEFGGLWGTFGGLLGTYGDFWGLYRTFWFFGGDFYGATICLASLIYGSYWICGI